ncbi:MAG: DUF6483 family protein [Candidatus Roseilinea sp.]|uniref:DUF6483 family protein n=1 Tax=Candidatus Roseilinea sp. TaxID=2838777 RepID=UPI00404A2E0F
MDGATAAGTSNIVSDLHIDLWLPATDVGEAAGSPLQDDGSQQALLRRSLAVFLACAEDGTLPPDHEQIYDIHQALNGIDYETLAPELKYRLFHYFEDSGQYAEAENVLFDLIESSPAPQALIAEGIAFYEWLLTRRRRSESRQPAAR